MTEQFQQGRVAVVTGATQGIGRAIARRLAAEGARVGVNGRVENEAMRAVVAETSGFAVPADMADAESVRSAFARVEAAHDAVDVLVCNAAYMSMNPLLDHDPADWWRNVDTNLTGTFRSIQAVLPGMRRRGAGRIVIVTSEWGVVGWPNATAYAASKAGLIALTKSLGRELAPENITVNAVAPGITDTPQLQVDADDAGLTLAEMHARYAAEIPAGRIGAPEDIAAAVALLCRPGLGAFVGQTISVNGGSTRARA
ncbi:NAD(P)-dependent dehydrogenase (short-subunit alcohol dehydrogenase family) [Mycobacterium frederiksbergense]|uniref:3-oxoacyl-[acyl-carrier-protein] reductase MabA n=1 Tax=Mycolicibacterium frederiksbergense TaxID=117567 RepID=A0ABT6L638_9MYCO|nr:SDR family oxidoreductase [Mycolicibacterium frederiksbergense]MDH6198419.1 NAD(P)-dependent dehydrogenase (short-subunit alcohol dehydrogenase family) [Mycolicibacterium frederiksbergense]